MIRHLFISLIVVVTVVGTVNCSSASAPGGPRIGREMTTTEMVGGPNGKEVSPRYCNTGIVTEVYGTVGKQKLYHYEYEVITSLGMRCSDGTDLGAMGTAKGEPFSISSKEGFTYMSVKSGAFIDHVTLWVSEQDHSRLRIVGEAGGPGGDRSRNLACDEFSGEKIIGYAGRAGDAVDAIKIICGEEGEKEAAEEKAAYGKAVEKAYSKK